MKLTNLELAATYQTLMNTPHIDNLILHKLANHVSALESELEILRGHRHYASPFLEAVDALKLIANRLPGCPCMDAPNLAREALTKLGVKQ